MINIIEKAQCSGCGACFQKCPKHCIALVTDNEGFWYPQVELSSCIDCGLCEKICHEIHPFGEREPLHVYAAINKNIEIRVNSSSGGIFSLVAERIINEGGVVFGARFDEEWQVKLDYTETLDGLAAFRGSKYVQSRTENTFQLAEQFLKDGRRVLFTGTPCQIAALHHFLGHDYENLLTVDFVCHGVPSPMVWGKYLDEITCFNRNKIKDICFRDKSNGWKRYNLLVSFKSSLSLLDFHGDNPYMRAFLNDMILRPSCYSCRAKHGSSRSDITIGDFWGIEYSHPELDDDKGTSLLFVNSSKGEHFYSYLNVLSVVGNLGNVIQYNKGIDSCVKQHPNRGDFFKRINNTISVVGLMKDELTPTFFHRFKVKLKRYFS